MLLLNRRELLASPALAFLFGSAAAAAPRQPAAGDIARLCALQDCTLLALRYRKVPGSVRDLLSRQGDFALLGHLVPSADFLSGAGDAPEVKALALGARMDKAISEALRSDAEDSGIYQDVAVLRATAAQPGKPGITEDQFLSLMKTIHRRLFIEIHTFEPDAENVEDWMDRVMRWNDDREHLIESYARVFARPEAAKVRRFLEEPRFYDAADGLLPLLSRARKGESVASDAIHRAITEASPQSVYGRAVRAGLKLLAA